ncbi:c-type cytochrome biogenesis protein CcmI [Caenimonas terrae]|uniref:C-type cytochrome biogenesis protein CcmI n=1 Tax=Caenimonas terrae TaxID=696074 RepID=A0ABW0NE40_9BURK
MTGFIVAAALAVLVTLALLLRPLVRIGAASALSHRQLNSAILREQLARLDQDLADGTIDAPDHAQAREELQRRVLQDTAPADAAPGLRAPRRTLAAIALALPVAAFGLYYAIGNPASLRPQAVAAATAPQEAEVERMVANLAAKLEREPSNLKGWAMLGRSYKVLGRGPEAERAYDRAGAFLDADAQMLADYADVAAANAGGNFAGKPTRLIERALRVDPRNPMALWLAGTAAMRAGQSDKALTIWNGLMQQLPPGSEDARMLQTAIDDVRGRAGGAGAGTAVAQAAEPAKQDKPAAPAAASVSGTVDLAPALRSRMAPDDTVMVIARLPGSRMPVAVLRVRGAQLPMQFTLDDSLAMNPQALISTARQVQVEARISHSGLAMPEAGDLISPVRTVQVGATGVTLNVAQVRP